MGAPYTETHNVASEAVPTSLHPPATEHVLQEPHLERTNWLRRLITLAAVALALVAGRLLDTDTKTWADNTWALAAMGAAVALMLLAGRRTQSELFNGQIGPIVALRRPWIVNYWWIAAAAVTLLSIARFDVNRPTGWQWLTHLLAVALCLIAARRGDHLDYTPSAAPEPASESLVQDMFKSTATWVAFGALIVATIVLRLWDLDGVPFGFWWDEAENARQGQLIRSDDTYRPVYIGTTYRAPAHMAYLMALSTGIFGDSVFAARLVVATMGIGSIAAGFFVVRRWWGPFAGVAFMALLALSRWHLTLSRFAMHIITVPLFSMLTLLFLHRGMRRGRQLDYAMAGLVAALGLSFYSAFGASLLAVGVIVVLIGLRCRSLGAMAPGLAIVAFVALVAFAPVLKFALLEGDRFFERQNEVSVFETIPDEEQTDALVDNALAYLEMFVGDGDRNGRHNIPGASMLSIWVGPLAILGFAVALRWIWRPLAFGLVLWVLAGLLPGIVTLPFEAPNSLRAVGSLIPAYALALVPLLVVVRQWRGVDWDAPFGWAGAGFVFALVSAVVLITGIGGVRDYFGTQADNAQVWAEHSTRETIAADLVTDIAPGEKSIWIVSNMRGHPTIRYLTHGRDDIRWFDPDDLFPLPIDPAVDALFVTIPETTTQLTQIQELYPDAVITRHSQGPATRTVLVSIEIPAYELSGETGIVQINPDGTTEVVAGVPSKAEPASQFVGSLVVPDTGQYAFRVAGAPDAQVTVDGVSGGACAASGDASRSLGQGPHDLQIALGGIVGDLDFQWRANGGDWATVPSELLRPAAPTGLIARHYPNGDLNADSEFERIDPTVDFFFHNLRLNRPYAIEWTGELRVDTDGEHAFWLRSDDRALLEIDGQLVAELSDNGETASSINLTAGLHTIRAAYFDTGSFSEMRVTWQEPGGDRRPIPTEQLLPQFARDDGGQEQLTERTTALRAITFDVPLATAVATWGERAVVVSPSLLTVLDPDGLVERTAALASADPTDVVVLDDGTTVVLDAAGFLEIVPVDPEIDAQIIDLAGEITNSRGLVSEGGSSVLIAHTPGSRVMRVDLRNPTEPEVVWSSPRSQPVDVTPVPNGFAVADPDLGLLSFALAPAAPNRCVPIERESTIVGPHLATAPDGSTWMTSPETSTLRQVTADGRELVTWEFAGFPTVPVGIAITPSGRIWLTDPSASRVLLATP